MKSGNPQGRCRRTRRPRAGFLWGFAFGLCAVGDALPDPTAAPRATPVLTWDCWLDATDGVAEIRCIQAPEEMAGKHADPPPNEADEAILRQIHEVLHGGSDVELLDLTEEGVEVLRAGSIWTVTVHSAPYRESWETGRPAQLVRALLCPAGVPCRVLIRRPGEPEPR